MWVEDYKRQLDFVVDLVRHLDIQPNATRVGLGIFSDTFHPVFDIGGYVDQGALVRAIRATRYLSGNTYTGRGLHGLRTSGFRPDVIRPNVTKVSPAACRPAQRHQGESCSTSSGPTSPR